MEHLPFIVLLLSIGVGGLLLIRNLLRKFFTPAPVPEVGYRFLKPALGLMALLLLIVVLPIGDTKKDVEHVDFLTVFMWNAAFFGFLGLIPLFCARGNGGGIALGMSPMSFRSLGITAAVYLLFYPMYFLVAYIWSLIWPVTEVQSVVQGMFQLEGAAFVIACFMGIVLVPFWEELIFRSFLQPALQSQLGTRGGIVATATLFALVHEIFTFLPIFVLALFFGYLYQRTSKIWVPYIAHALHNGLTILAHIVFKDYFIERITGS